VRVDKAMNGGAQFFQSTAMMDPAGGLGLSI
jgi:hypothetical protein